ncbi:hypothetical protein OCU04_004417 [Sclerotinia nivalis]|uniref:Uncharacterized protein n=1 Tax=Sclerotinia nivalis TaxID=352851 RepID=A0A9X0DMD7_9HELO|nr:hypothetical protein OCU04_004417 [Sclerotinia nivalis]
MVSPLGGVINECNLFLSMPVTKSLSVHNPVRIAFKIDRSGTERTPCNTCARSHRLCVIDESLSSRCSECLRSKKGHCNAGSSMLSFYESLDRQQEQLRLEEEKEFARVQESNAKILRLCKQQKFLRKRKREMIRCDAQSLDALDALKEEERLEKERIEKEKAGAAIAASAPSGSSSFGFHDSSGPEVFDEAYWASLDTSNGMPPFS